MSRKNGRRALLVVGRLQVGPPITLCVLQRPLTGEELFVKRQTHGVKMKRCFLNTGRSPERSSLLTREQKTHEMQRGARNQSFGTRLMKVFEPEN